jgi:CelD/BcsL family acetyltransferase involved in cellulose biosynthesis
VVDVEVRRDLGPYGERWDQLVLLRDPPPLELRSWWLDGIAGPDTRFVLVVEGGELLGGLAVDVTRRWGVTRLQLLGDEFWPDELDILADPVHEQAVAEAITAWLSDHPHGVVSFRGVRDGALLRAVLPPTVTEVEVPGAPFIELPSSFETYLAERSPNLRSEIRKQRRRLDEEGVVYRTLDPSELDLGLSSLRELHANRFGTESAFTPQFERFARAAPEGVRRGELVFHVLMDGDRVIASKVNVEVGAYISGFQSGMAPRSERRFRGAGTVLLTRILEVACANGVHQLNLSRDPSDYKARWMSGIHPQKEFTGSWGWRPPAVARAARTRRRVVHRASGVHRELRRTTAP